MTWVLDSNQINCTTWYKAFIESTDVFKKIISDAKKQIRAAYCTKSLEN